VAPRVRTHDEIRHRSCAVGRHPAEVARIPRELQILDADTFLRRQWAKIRGADSVARCPVCPRPDDQLLLDAQRLELTEHPQRLVQIQVIPARDMKNWHVWDRTRGWVLSGSAQHWIA